MCIHFAECACEKIRHLFFLCFHKSVGGFFVMCFSYIALLSCIIWLGYNLITFISGYFSYLTFVDECDNTAKMKYAQFKVFNTANPDRFELLLHSDYSSLPSDILVFYPETTYHRIYIRFNFIDYIRFSLYTKKQKFMKKHRLIIEHKNAMNKKNQDCTRIIIKTIESDIEKLRKEAENNIKLASDITEQVKNNIKG